MPLIYYRSVKNAEVALWKATEPTSFFRDELLNQSFPIVPGDTISHPEKLHQWFASRYLLCEIFPAAIQLYSDRKPYLFNGPHISFSHSQDVVAVMVSAYPAGIDIQWPDPKLSKISVRFANPTDLKIIHSTNELLDLNFIWSIKEAVFKTYGTQLPFKEISIESYDPVSDKALIKARRKGKTIEHQLEVAYVDEMCLAYVLQ
jgi:4'-phosphopantetheinyl transferase EntD